MHTFLALLNEKLLGHTETWTPLGNGRVEKALASVWENPTASELTHVVKPDHQYPERFGRIGYYHRALMTPREVFVWAMDEGTHSVIARYLKDEERIPGPYYPCYLIWFPRVKRVGMMVSQWGNETPLDDDAFLKIAQANKNLTRLGTVEMV